METRELEYYIAIMEEGSLTKAAERLYVSQPTLSKYLQRLETQIGTPLFEHQGRKLIPTFAGLRYHDHAVKILNSVRNMNNELSEISSEHKGRLRIGMPSVRSSFTLPNVLPQFRNQYPEVEIELTEDHSQALEQALINGDIDIAFFNVIEENKDEEYIFLQNEELLAILPKGHALSAKNSVTLKDLENETFFLLSESQRTGSYIRTLLNKENLHPHQLTNSNVRSSISLAANGYGVTFLSKDLLDHMPGLDPLLAIPLSCDMPKIRFCAVLRKGSYRSSYLNAFIEITKQFYAK